MNASATTEPGASVQEKATAVSTEDVQSPAALVGSRAATPNHVVADKPANGTATAFLSAPPLHSGPIRPLSPDTFSNLSAEEYQELRASRSPSCNGPHVALPAEPRPHGWSARLRAFYSRNLGLGYMLVAQVFGTMMNVTTRLLEVEGNHRKGMHPFQILFARMSITVVLASGYMWYKRTPDFPLGMKEVRWLLVARGFGGFFGVFGMYYSLLYLPLADATVITFLSPSLACWACSLLINEPFGRIEQLAAFVSLGGVLLIAKPSTLLAVFHANANSPDSLDPGNPVAGPISAPNATMPMGGDAANYDDVTPQQRLFAVGVALLGVLGSATAFTTIRWIGKRAHPLLSVNYFAVWCTLVSFIMMLTLPGVGFLLPATPKEWGYLFFLGTCGFVMQFLLAAALAYEKSSRATNITYMQMLFALGSDKIFFNHTPDGMSIAGSALILGSAVYVATMANAGQRAEGKEVAATEGEVEAQQGLLTDVETGEDHERLPLEEVQLRTLR